ncbi:MAG: carbohydrate kinase family protein [Planctomycetota bacterium]|jgi:fructokinase
MKSNRDNLVVVGLGEILWDMLPEGKKLGGAPANFAYHAHCLGAQGYVVSCIGKDALGDEILDHIDELELNRSFVAVDRNHPTGTVSIELDENGKPDYIIHENVAWDFIPLNDELLKFASNADAVCFGSLCQRSEISRNTVREFLKATKEDCIRIFDINIRQNYYTKEVLESMLEFTNVFKLNDEELPLVAELLEIDGTDVEILKKLESSYGLRLIVLTKGGDGSILYGDGHTSHLNVEDVQIADTVGAGDSFTAAVAIGLLNKKPIDQIHDHANRLAAFVCTQNGATPEVPEELLY